MPICWEIQTEILSVLSVETLTNHSSEVTPTGTEWLDSVVTVAVESDLLPRHICGSTALMTAIYVF